MFTVLGIVALLSLLVIAGVLNEIARVLHGIRDAITLEERERIEKRERRRTRAREQLKEAMDTLADPHFCEMDYGLGTGHGVRRAERILAAKTWDEVEEIAHDEDLETVKDKIEFFRRPVPKELGKNE
jgi:hypothetical protein